MAPDHHIWRRIRRPHHGGAIRSYCKSPVTEYGRNSPIPCNSCDNHTKKRKPDEVPQQRSDFLDQIDLMIKEQDVHKGSCKNCVFMCVCVKYLCLAQQIIVGNLFTLADTSTVYAVEE